MKQIRLPRLSLSFPLLLLGLVALPLLLEDRNASAAGGQSTVSSSFAVAEEAPGECGDKGGDQQEGQDAGRPLRPHAPGLICEEVLQAGILQAEPVVNRLGAGGPGSGLSCWMGTHAPLELNTGLLPCTASDSSSCIPAGSDRVNHPVRGPPAS
ncbi:MAG: hypothetical protein VX496_08635 [Planctomycetota bacterium]|nr:hypothetical protein [Planctomycetota bacterium]